MNLEERERSFRVLRWSPVNAENKTTKETLIRYAASSNLGTPEYETGLQTTQSVPAYVQRNKKRNKFG
jgi:hypothetical protein